MPPSPTDPAFTDLPRRTGPAGRGGWARAGIAAAVLAGAGVAVAFVADLVESRDRARQEAEDARAGRAAAEGRFLVARGEALGAAAEADRARAGLEAAEARTAQAQCARAAAEGACRLAEDAASTLLLEARLTLAPLGRHAALERLARAALEGCPAGGDEGLSPAAQEARAQALRLLGESLLARERPDEAEEPLRQAVALERLRAAAAPALPARAQALAESLSPLARCLAERKRPAEALEVLEEAVAVWRRLLDLEPSRPEWLGALGLTLAQSAAVASDLGDPRQARARAEEGVRLLEALAAAEPAEPAWLAGEARAVGALADVEAAGADPSPALADYERALSRLTPLADAPGAAVGLRIELVELRRRQGALLVRAGKPDLAVDALREALAVSAGLAGRDAERLDVQVLLGHTCDDLCDALEANAEWEDALEGRHQTAAVWARVAALEEGRVERRLCVLRALEALGDLLERRGQAEQALKTFREGASLAVALSESAPASTYGSDLAQLHDRAARVLLALGRRGEALETWRAALAAIEPLAKRTPENAFWQADLARIWWRLGAALAADELERPEGLRALKRAQRLLEALGAAQRLPAYARGWPEEVRAALAATATPSPTPVPADGLPPGPPAGP